MCKLRICKSYTSHASYLTLECVQSITFGHFPLDPCAMQVSGQHDDGVCQHVGCVGTGKQLQALGLGGVEEMVREERGGEGSEMKEGEETEREGREERGKEGRERDGRRERGRKRMRWKEKRGKKTGGREEEDKSKGEGDTKKADERGRERERKDRERQRERDEREKGSGNHLNGYS